MNITPGTKALQEGGLPSNTCCRRCHLEGLISSNPAAQVQVPPSSICDERKRHAMLPDKWSCYREATNGCSVYQLCSIRLQMISLRNLKPCSLGSLLFARQQRTGGVATKHRWSILRWRNLRSLRAKIDKKKTGERKSGGKWEVTEGKTTETVRTGQGDGGGRWKGCLKAMTLDLLPTS